RRLCAQLIEQTLPAVAGTTTRASVCISLHSAARGPGLKCDLREDRIARAAGWRVAVPAAAAGVAIATSGTERATLRLTNTATIAVLLRRLPIRPRTTTPRVIRRTVEIVAGAVAVAVRRCQIGEHTSELQSRENLVCRLLLEKKKKIR